MSWREGERGRERERGREKKKLGLEKARRGRDGMGTFSPWNEWAVSEWKEERKCWE